MEDAQETRFRDDVFRGHVFYDGECEFCIAAARRFGPRLERRGFSLVAYQTPWVSERTGLPLDVLAKDMWLMSADGRLLRGIDAHACLARTMWWARPFAVATRVPGLRQVLRLAYRLIASNRARVPRYATWFCLTAAVVVILTYVSCSLGGG
jgi:predicted DCC family thiol-disulfide oxidoreductase YuxK